MRIRDLAALGRAIDDKTEGAIAALRYECDTNGWTPHIWAQTPAEGSPAGLTRLLLYGDSDGVIKYWDSVLILDTTGLAVKIKLASRRQEIRLNVNQRDRKPASKPEIRRGLN